ncbi:hypothetical protein BDZ89DRAFT_1140777 [Hymenopellis radicata]|nr:hypothetical protein BDZ89DRAFT_1140777 [Hymenopellis radicata]
MTFSNSNLCLPYPPTLQDNSEAPWDLSIHAEHTELDLLYDNYERCPDLFPDLRLPHHECGNESDMLLDMLASTGPYSMNALPKHHSTQLYPAGTQDPRVLPGPIPCDDNADDFSSYYQTVLQSFTEPSSFSGLSSYTSRTHPQDLPSLGWNPSWIPPLDNISHYATPGVVSQEAPQNDLELGTTTGSIITSCSSSTPGSFMGCSTVKFRLHATSPAPTDSSCMNSTIIGSPRLSIGSVFRQKRKAILAQNPENNKRNLLVVRNGIQV